MYGFFLIHGSLQEKNFFWETILKLKLLGLIM